MALKRIEREKKKNELTESKFSEVARSYFLADTEVGTDRERIRGGDTIPGGIRVGFGNTTATTEGLLGRFLFAFGATREL